MDEIQETLKALSISGADYYTSLQTDKIIGQEIIKESVKRFYAWTLEKFKKQNKEQDLIAYVENPSDAKLEGKVESVLETILIDENSKNELKSLIEQVRNEINNYGNLIQGNGNIISGNTINGDFVMGNKTTNYNG